MGDGIVVLHFFNFNRRFMNLKQKKLKATKDMLEIGKSHPPGQRTEEEIKKIKD